MKKPLDLSTSGKHTFEKKFACFQQKLYYQLLGPD